MNIGNIALSGAQFQAKRFAASAQNVAAATVGHSVNAVEGEASARQAAVRVEGVSQAEGGVRGEVRPDPRATDQQVPGQQAPGQEPSYLSQAQEIRLEEEMVRAREAKHLHEANLKVMRAEKEMLGTLLDREV